jgi:hypothetical protein
MNRLNNERQKWLLAELHTAYLDARRGKLKKPRVKEFEPEANARIKTLAQQIHSRTYQPLPSTAFIVHDPVIREIFAADFSDRIVHHLLFNQVESWWDTHFHPDNYSCRKGKGTLYGIRRLDHHIRAVSENYHKPAYILKLDISGYFMSLDRKLLFKRAIWGLARQFPSKGYVYHICYYLWKQIIFNDPLENVRINCPKDHWKDLPINKSMFNQKPGKGIAIGNLTSQLLSNVFLDQLDRFVTQDLGFKHYGRYVDDFYMVSTSKNALKNALPKIEKYLKDELKLTLHPKKRYLQECHKGISFLGAVIYPHRILPGKRLKHNLIKALSDPNCSPETRASYLGLVKHYKNYKLLKNQESAQR